MILILLYVALSVSGLLLLKIGTSHEMSINVTNGALNLKISWYVIGGLFIYVCSFIVSLLAMRTTNLSIFYPVSVGLGYVVVCVLSYAILKETISKQQLIGMLIILAGLLVMNIGRTS